MLRLIVCAVVWVLIACARPSPPPGGEEDRLPPRVMATTPEARTVDPEFTGPVVIRFDETLSEQGIRDAVSVSPQTGEVFVKHDGDVLEVRIAGEWRANTVYRIVVEPVLRDRFNNTRRDPVDLVFSTGPEIPETALAGVVTDRLTGRPAAARVEAIHLPDSTVYVSRAAEDGVFAFRFIPTGEYLLRAFEDQNRNRELNDFERRDALPITLQAADTTLASLALLATDTTPARVARAEALDSLHVVIAFDDYFPPDAPPARDMVQIYHLPDSMQIGLVATHTRSVFDEARRTEAPALVPDSTLPDSVAAEALPPELRPGAQPRAARPSSADTTARPVLPTREIVAELAQPLRPGERYRVIVRDATNIAGLPGGGGTATFQAPQRPTAPPPAAPDSVPADTTRNRR